MTNTEFNQCVELHSDGLYRFLLKSFQNYREDAEDTVQNAFVTLWQNVEKVEFSKAKSYLFTVAYRDMIDHTRKMKRVEKMETKHERISGSHKSYSGLKEILDEALEKLPEIQKTVVMLRDYEGYDYDKIGEITGLNTSQVKVYIFRARQTLKNYLVSVEKLI